MQEEKIYDLGDGFTLFKSVELSDEVLDFLENTAFGTSDNLYRHYYIREYVANTPRTVFFLLRDEPGELMGVAALCYRTFPGPPSYEGCYIRYYAASPKVRGQKLTKRFSKTVMEWMRSRQTDPIVFFGSIEGTNKASKAVADHLGFQAFAPLKVVGFSRFRPQLKGEVSRVTEEEWRELLPKIEARYGGYAFWSNDYLNQNNAYYVLKKDGKIICGAQAHQAHWVIENMPGAVGKYLLPILPHIPVVKDIFNPKAFHFINFEGLFIEEGHEGDLVDLFESVLFLDKKHGAMIWFDEREPLYAFLVQQNRLGLLARFTAGARATFVVDFSCFNEKDAAALQGRLCYGKGYDYI